MVLGFKETIKDKMFVFWGHIQIAPFNPNPTTIITPEPFDYDPALVEKISSEPDVKAIYPFALKAAILHSPTSMEGLKLKGVDARYDFKSNDAITFQGNGIDFETPDYSRRIVLSRSTLDKLDRSIGDSLLVFFIDPEEALPRVRKMQIAGTFHTGMEEVDNTFALCDIRLLRRVSNWDALAINGYQVQVDDYARASDIADRIYQNYLDPPMTRTTIQELYPNIFNWLALMDTNAYIILTIMAIVAVINISTALLIFIMERTKMIGILKAMGTSPQRIQWIFVYHAASIAIKGIAGGTLLGVGLCWLQYHTRFVQMDETAYYMSYVPIKLVTWQVLLIDIATLVFCTGIMFLPTIMAKKINTVKALRFK